MILEISACAISLFGFAVYYGSMKWLKVKHELLNTGKLNSMGIKILHISDLHSNNQKKMHIDIWSAVENLDFDLAVITGDLIQEFMEEIRPHIPHLKTLVERVPVCFAEGNHECSSKGCIFDELEKLGIKILRDKRITCMINENKIDVVGLKDFYELKKNKLRGLHQLFALNKSENFTLVLSHQPQIIDYIEQYKPELILSGHTHGGQVRFPFLPALYAPGQGILPRYDSGWYKKEHSCLYISRGVGATHFNIRFFNRPEIAVIHVR